MANKDGTLTLDDLRAFIEKTRNLPGDVELGVSDHFGELVPMFIEPEIMSMRRQFQRGGDKKMCVVFERVWVGDEPQ